MNWKLCCSLVSFPNSVIQSVSHQTIIPQNRESHSHHTASVQNPDSALTQAIVYVCALFFSYRKIWDNTDMGPGIIQPGPSWEYQMVGLFNLLISLHKIKSEIEGTDKRQVFSLLLGAPALARNCKLPDTGFLNFQELSYPNRWGTFKQTKCDNTDREKEPKDTDKRWTLPGGAGGILPEFFLLWEPQAPRMSWNLLCRKDKDIVGSTGKGQKSWKRARREHSPRSVLIPPE